MHLFALRETFPAHSAKGYQQAPLLQRDQLWDNTLDRLGFLQEGDGISVLQAKGFHQIQRDLLSGKQEGKEAKGSLSARLLEQGEKSFPRSAGTLWGRGRAAVGDGKAMEMLGWQWEMLGMSSTHWHNCHLQWHLSTSSALLQGWVRDAKQSLLCRAGLKTQPTASSLSLADRGSGHSHTKLLTTLYQADLWTPQFLAEAKP